ncbi:uncharacterized protein LOC128133733 [Lactuca sativa]|uniref:uncharacterized protein LOC128133733 n=1 Tax=Lactuca sativa TaxID=4236 RepID=UPI0022AF7B3F|nr:uncharacterized protein LOC128133733 [Lactuca sativa]
MAPRKQPGVRPPPTPRGNPRRTPPVTQTSVEMPNQGGDPEVTNVNQTFQMNSAMMQNMLAQGIATALAAYEAARNGNTGNSGSGTTAIHQSNTRHCSYKDFMSCKPRPFYGTEGAVGLSCWIEKTEAVFHISACPDDYRVKYATCTLMDSALTWWNNHAKSMGIAEAYAMGWESLKQLMTKEYCPRQEIQALEQELWNLVMKGSEVAAYTFRFNDLANLCPGMVTPEDRKIERYIWGLASPVQGLVTTSKPSTFDSAKQLAYQLTGQCVRQGTMNPPAEKKNTGGTNRKFHGETKEDSNHHKVEPEPLAVYAAVTNTPTPTKSYYGTLPHCIKCNFHHVRNCREVICNKCNMRGHISRYCRRTPTTTAEGIRNCYECNQPGHFRKDCPQLKNQGGNGRVLMITSGEALPEPPMVIGTFHNNNV